MIDYIFAAAENFPLRLLYAQVSLRVLPYVIPSIFEIEFSHFQACDVKLRICQKKEVFFQSVRQQTGIAGEL